VVCSNKPAAQSEIARLEQDEATDREQKHYQSARGNLGSLRSYVATCEVCAYKQAAQTEISQLELTDATAQEQRLYFAARGDLGRLRAYVQSCKICAYEADARQAISQLEAADEMARNPTIIFNVTNNHPNSVEMVFHSATDKSRVWPGGGQVYVIRDSNVHTYKLSCTRGENICYGAWGEGNPLSSYWGTGYKGREPCQNCCVSCPAQVTSPIVLETYNSRQPTPSLTWLIRSNFPYSVDVAFYSSTRRGLSWPGNNQVWTITNSDTQNYKLTCLAGERICYGAWPRGDPSRYWGVGSGGQQGCSNCCYTCNGGETNTIQLN
jgi:hypothetical protein